MMMVVVMMKKMTMTVVRIVMIIMMMMMRVFIMTISMTFMKAMMVEMFLSRIKIF